MIVPAFCIPPVFTSSCPAPRIVCPAACVHTVLSVRMRLLGLSLITMLPDPDSVAPPLQARSVRLPMLLRSQLPSLTSVPVTAAF
jgi:hypothetical protein